MSNLFEKLSAIHHLMEEQLVTQKKILNLEEASKFLGISKSDLYKRTSSNSIPFFKPSGKIIFFRKSDLEKWMLSNRQGTVDEIIEKGANFKIIGGRRSQ